MANLPYNLGKMIVEECQTIVSFTPAKDDGGGSGNNWNSTMIKSPPSADQHSVTGWMPFLSPSKQCQSIEGKTSIQPWAS